MTITHHGGGTLLYLSYDELTAASNTPSSPTQDELLPLVYAALGRSKRPLPHPMEVRAFPSRRGTLLLILPCLNAVQGGILTKFS